MSTRPSPSLSPYISYTLETKAANIKAAPSLLRAPSQGGRLTRRGDVYGHHFVPDLQPLGDLVQNEFAALLPQGYLCEVGVERSICVLPMESRCYRSLLSLAYRRICIAYELHFATQHYAEATSNTDFALT